MLPVEQLTTLIIASDIAISDAATSVYMDILPAFKGLVNLEISLQVHCQLTTSITSVARLLPALKSLKIDYRSPIHCYDFLRCLTSPLLERLSICGYLHHRDDMASTFTSIADFQRRSATSLSSLTLEYFDWDNVELFTKHLTETIGIFLDLQSLQLHIVQVNVDLLFRALTCSEGSQILLPKLTHLELQPYDRDTTRLSDGLTSMVLSRWWPDDERTTSAGLVRLQKVILRDFLYDEQITRISDLSGLKLSLDLCSLE
ncbi:hypothetical protein BT96DRAFT_471831 [Gymnopus androsaceus JB14]|uniref:F-box domain-containing protein n=1 Tax=Gymnopus androsaceus JB14 TaxID=1447944 RepID=A0A6A4IPH5_9AGAR|nr:hypothetical protein BT96DRAFT_471831 [Gymnopus androsaceus JB14]